MALWQHYHLARTVEETLHLLAQHDGRARIIAGGTDLLLDMEEGKAPPVEALVDVTRVEGMRDIYRDGEYIVVGAAVTHSQIEASDVLREHATCLVESCSVIGGPQVRNVATLGGNVAHALPAADGTVSLVALEAEAQVARLSPTGEVTRDWVPILSLFRGPGQSAVDAGREVIVAFRFLARRPHEASAFERIMRPQGIALPILGLAARVQLTPDGFRYERVSICIGPAGPVPFRAHGAERVLQGSEVGEASLAAAVDEALAEARLRTSKHRATREYREEMVRVLMRRVIPRAVERARRAEGE